MKKNNYNPPAPVEEQDTNEKSHSQRKWPLPLYGCMSYKDLKGNPRWWPTFCCTAMICTNIIAGQTCTEVVEEKPCCYDLGMQGCCVCIATIPLSLYHPIAGFGVFIFLTNFVREKAIKKYSLEEENYCCCGSCDYVCNYLHFGCNYPCSFFQVHMSILQFKEEEEMNKQPVITSQPVVSVKKETIQTKVSKE